MQLFLKTQPLQEPLTLDEVKIYLKVSSDQEDDFLRSLIVSARAYVEGLMGRALLKQKWVMNLTPPYPRTFPLLKQTGKNLEIDLPFPPLLEVESIKVREQNIHFKSEENKVFLSSFFWNKALSITYWAGYGETAASVPPDLKMAVLMATRFFYDNQKAELPLLNPFKVFRVV